MTLESPEVTEAGLAAQAAAGSRAAFEALVGRYAGRLSAFLRTRSTSREDLEDLVQETFLRAYRNIDRYDARWKFATWLYTIGVRLAISRHRAAGSRPVQGIDSDPACPLPGPQDSLLLREEAERRKNIWALAGALGPAAYEALWLRYAEDMPVKEIARAMGKTQMGVRALLHRSRERLAEKLKAAGEQERPAAEPAVGAGADMSGAAGRPSGAGAVAPARKYSVL